VAPFDAARAREHQEAWAKHLGVPVEITNSIGMKLRIIPPGEFLMGAIPDDRQAEPEERPQHPVRLTRPFYLGAYEVTNAQFQTFVTATGYQTEVEADGQGAWTPSDHTRHPARTWRNLAAMGANLPVTCVTWKDDVEFCAWLSGREGRGYRHPTDAEWEYACRAGTTTFYSFGDRPDVAQANVSTVRLTGVGSRPPNAFGLYDMHGNAHERCVDGRRAYTVEPVTDPLGPMLSDSFRVSRGAAASSQWPSARASHRFIDAVPYALVTQGFRVAIVGDLKETAAATKDAKPTGEFIALTDAELRRIAALPAAQQIDEVRTELEHRNPGLTARAGHGSRTTQQAPPALALDASTGDDAKRASELEVNLRAAMQADRWEEGILAAEKLVALWNRVKDDRHQELASAVSRLSTYRLVAAMGKHERAEFIAADDLSRLAETWHSKGKYVDAQPLFEKALEIRRRVLTNDHPDTAASARSLAANSARLPTQAEQRIGVAIREDRWDEAITAAEELLALRKRLQGEKHFEVVSASWRVRTYRLVAARTKEERAEYVYGANLFRQAHALYLQGKDYAVAQPLFEKALEISRRLLTDEHPETATIYVFLALNLRSQGKYAAAQPLFEKALEIQRRLLTDDHPDTAMCYGSLANNLRFQGKYTEAQPLFEKCLEIRRRLLTDNHPDTELSYNMLAVNLNAQGKHAEAKPLFEKALEIRRRVLTNDHPDTATSARNLTGSFAQLARQAEQRIGVAIREDRWDEAVTAAEELLALRERLQGEKHFEVVSASWRVRTYRLTAAMPKELRAELVSADDLNRRAESLRAKSMYLAAQPLFDKALDIRRRLLTDDHPDVARSYDGLGWNLNAQGKYAAARPLFEKALDIRRRLLTDDHPDTAMSYNHVAWNLHVQGKYVAAQSLFEKALDIHRRLLTDNHPDTASSYNYFATNLAEQGKYTAAQPLLEKALEIRRRLLTDNHPDTATSYNNVAWNLNYQAKFTAAQPLFEKALEIRRRLLTDDHPDTASSYNGVAWNLNVQGKYATAQPLFERALEISRRHLTDDHPQTATSYDYVALNLAGQGKYAAAQPIFQRALEIRRRLLTDDHPDTAKSYNYVAGNLNAQENYAAAQPLYEKALEIRRRLLTDDHPDTTMTCLSLAYCLFSQRKYTEAEPLLEKALEIYRRTLTDDDPNRAGIYDALALTHKSQGRYAAAQPLFEKALELFRRRGLTDEHLPIVQTSTNLAYNLRAQGRYPEAVDLLARAAPSLEASRRHAAFDGLDRSGVRLPDRNRLYSALLARLGRGAEAWQRLEDRSGRGLLDAIAAREDKRLTREERDSLRQHLTELERLDSLFESPLPASDQAERRKRLDDLRQERHRAHMAMVELQSRLVKKYGPLAGEVASLAKIQSALPADTALIAWVDVGPQGPNPADPDGDHWGLVVRATGDPVSVKLQGTGNDHHWTEADEALPGLVRDALRDQAGPGGADWRPLARRLYEQRLLPLAPTLAATVDGLPAARSLVVMASVAMASVPVEALFGLDDRWTISYAPSATVLTYLRERPRPDVHAGLLALGDPIFDEAVSPSEPAPLPGHGLLLTGVVPGSNAAKHGLKGGDVLVAYDGTPLHTPTDLKPVPLPGDPVPVEIWRDGKAAQRTVDRGELGAVIDPQPAPAALAGERRFQRLLATARSGDEGAFARLPGTRLEVTELAGLFAGANRPARVLLEADASEPELDRLASSGELGRFGFIHLATHAVIDEDVPQRTALVLTQTGLPDPLTQALARKPVYDGRLVVREIQRDWDLKAELVTLSACETARGRFAHGEGFIGFTQSLLLSGAHSVCLSLWKVDDTATALLMRRFYANLLGTEGKAPQPKAEALAEAKAWLRGLNRTAAEALAAQLSAGDPRGKGAALRRPVVPQAAPEEHPYEHPYYWAAFVLIGDPD
jgi:tetratricopeptide (TPR) repeat protein/formylglycine-generating enzyme required for sulfatase activity